MSKTERPRGNRTAVLQRKYRDGARKPGWVISVSGAGIIPDQILRKRIKPQTPPFKKAR